MNPCRARTLTLLLTLLTGPAGFAAPAAPPAAAASTVSSEVGSYDVGLLLGSQLQHNGVVPNLSQEALIRGLKEAVGGRAISNEQREAALNFMRQAHDLLADRNRAEGREFLARNAKQPGIKTMPSGLQYRVLAEGVSGGKSPTATDTVTVRYRASLSDGTEFDRSEAHDRPASPSEQCVQTMAGSVSGDEARREVAALRAARTRLRRQPAVHDSARRGGGL